MNSKIVLCSLENYDNKLENAFEICTYDVNYPTGYMSWKSLQENILINSIVEPQNYLLNKILLNFGIKDASVNRQDL